MGILLNLQNPEQARKATLLIQFFKCLNDTFLKNILGIISVMIKPQAQLALVSTSIMNAFSPILLQKLTLAATR